MSFYLTTEQLRNLWADAMLNAPFENNKATQQFIEKLKKITVPNEISIDNVRNVFDKLERLADDYAFLDAKTLDVVLVNLKKSGHPMKAEAQRLVKYWRCFAQLLETTGRCIRGEHFTKEAIESCGLQSRVLEEEKDSKDSPTLPKLSDSTDVLA